MNLNDLLKSSNAAVEQKKQHIEQRLVEVMKELEELTNLMREVMEESGTSKYIRDLEA